MQLGGVVCNGCSHACGPHCDHFIHCQSRFHNLVLPMFDGLLQMQCFGSFQIAMIVSLKHLESHLHGSVAIVCHAFIVDADATLCNH